MRLSSALPLRPANLEQVGEIGRKSNRKLDATRLVVEISNAQPLEASSLPQKARTPQVDEVMLDVELSGCGKQVRIGEIAGEGRVIVPQARTEPQRTRAIERYGEMRQMAGVEMIDSLHPARTRQRVTVVVEHAEGIAMFQDQGARVLMRSRGGNGEGLGSPVSRRWPDKPFSDGRARASLSCAKCPSSTRIQPTRGPEFRRAKRKVPETPHANPSRCFVAHIGRNNIKNAAALQTSGTLFRLCTQLFADAAVPVGNPRGTRRVLGCVVHGGSAPCQMARAATAMRGSFPPRVAGAPEFPSL